MNHRIVIVGGGFGGVECARLLRKRLPVGSHEIVLFNQENYMMFSPLLAEVAGASINAEDIVAPLRTLLPGVICRNEEVQDIDFARNRLAYTSLEGDARQLSYDHIVLAGGSDVNLSVIPGMADHSFPLKSVANAMALRFQVIRQLEKAEICDHPIRRTRYLSFIVVGGGFSGVEIAGEINDFLRDVIRFFPRLKEHHPTVTLVHSRDEILPEITPPLRAFALEKMKRAGIRMILNARAAAVTRRGVTLTSGDVMAGETVVCTIGNTAPALIEKMSRPKTRGRLLTDPDMRLNGLANAWAIGDCALIVNAFDGSPSPATGQFAERQGRQVAENIVRAVHRRATRPFRFRPLGQLCSIGGKRGVADILGVRVSGHLAWFLWRGVYLFKLPTWGRRIRVGFDWAWNAFFPRDMAHPRANLSSQISKAYYQKDDIIFRPNEPAHQFYVIEKGRVEIFNQPYQNAVPESVGVLTAGDFFGEMALIDRRPHKLGARAVEPTKLLVIGSDVFNSFSTVMPPLKNMIAGAIRRRTPDFWKRFPQKADVLSRLSVQELMSEPTETLSAGENLGAAFRAMEGRAGTPACVVNGGGTIAGLLTWSDVFRAVESGATLDTPVGRVMVPDPHFVVRNATALSAASLMRTHRLKGVPVVEDASSKRLCGFLRAESLLRPVLKASEMAN